jgi:excisionase family DNA binding protein
MNNTNPFDTIDSRLSNIENLLLDLKLKPQDSKNHNEDVWFDLTELCNYLPDKPKKPTVYAWVSTNTIPCYKGKKKLRFLKSEIDAWLITDRNKTNSEIEEAAESYLLNNKGGNKS